MENFKLKISGIEKTFPGVRALSNVDFAVRAGTVHILCGESGAGKSSIIKIINGIYQPDAGEILIDGISVKIHSPIEAKALGIAMISEELNYVPELSVEESLFMGRLPVNYFKKIKWREVRRAARKILEEERLPYSPKAKLKSLSISDIQILEITRAVYCNADIIVMDEPTSALTKSEADRLFKKIEELKDRGVTIIYASHKVDEVFNIADDVTVLRDGETVHSVSADRTTATEVISWTAGRRTESVYPKEEIKAGATLLEVKNLKSGRLFEDISFYVREGEIIGFAGIIGSGRSELIRAIFGLEKIDGGSVKKRGKNISIRSVQDSVNAGIAMLSEDRLRYGNIPTRSVMENASLSSLEKFFVFGIHFKSKERETISEFLAKMNVKMPSLETQMQHLSVGNQQKVLLSRWIIRNPDILILDEPTSGIDVGTRFEVYKLITEMAKQGKAVIIASSAMEELIGMCDRIYVMGSGRLSAELNRDEFSQERILQYAMQNH